MFFSFYAIFVQVLIGINFSQFKKSHRSFCKLDPRICIKKEARSGSALRKTAGSRSAKNECGSTALVPKECAYDSYCSAANLTEPVTAAN